MPSWPGQVQGFGDSLAHHIPSCEWKSHTGSATSDESRKALLSGQLAADGDEKESPDVVLDPVGPESDSHSRQGSL